MSDLAGNRAAWNATYKRNNIDADTLERKIYSTIKDDEIHNYLFELNRNREESKNQTIKRLEALRGIYFEITSKLQESTLPIDHQNFQSFLESFETKLTSFKLSMRNEFDIFDTAETQLNDDLENISTNIDAWSSSHESNKEVDLKIRAEQNRRIQERQTKDVERKAAIGALDRKVNLSL